MKFHTGADGSRLLRVSGHAGWGPRGTDIVCAAVSILVENLGNSLDLLVEAQPSIVASDGLYEVRVAGNSDRATEVDLLLASTLLGLRSLAETYPDRIVVGE